ncbi:GGDEF domain-containing protein [Clostridium manihotivorum]|nr:diguanylate cyclase [Clostridium manihotivorum]
MESDSVLGDLFINSAILIAILSVGTQCFREKSLTAIKTKSAQVLTGALIGILGCILMKFSVHINSKVILDFRNIPIILAAVFSGCISSVTAGIIVGVFRILFFGISNASVVGFSIAATIGAGCGLIGKTNLSSGKKWALSTLVSLLLGTIGFVLNLKEKSLLIDSLLCYWGASIVMCIFIYYYMMYLYESGNLYRRYREEVKKDYLTGLNNVRQFDNVINEVFLKVKEKHYKEVALIYLDIDFFKKINDSFGHGGGDIVLKDFSYILKNIGVSSDFIFRNGGEEFSIILPDCSEDVASKVAEKIRLEVERYSFKMPNDEVISITVSIGVAVYPDMIDDIDELVSQADNALYTAKKCGRNKTVLAGKKKYIIK